MSVQVWIQTFWNSDSVPERFFWKGEFRKKVSRRQKKNMKNYPACKGKELKSFQVEYWEVQKQGTYRQELQHIGDLDMRKDTLRDLLVEFQQRRFKVRDNGHS